MSAKTPDPNSEPSSDAVDAAEEIQQLRASLADARAELASLADSHLRQLELEETLRAIRNGEVDALVVRDSPPGQQVFTLTTADRPYRIFVENMQEGAATLDADGIVLFVNARLEELLGCSSFEIVAQPMTDFIAEGSRHDLAVALASATEGATLELELRPPTGGVVAVLGGISRVQVDEQRLTCLTFTDLTSEHLLLEEVRANQRRFEALYKGAPVPAFTWQNTAAGPVLIDYNEAAAAFTGGAIAGHLGMNATAYPWRSPDAQADLARCFADHTVVEHPVTVEANESGAPAFVQVTMVPVPPDLVVIHKQDVTERWVAEAALRTSEERYRAIVENAQEGISILDAAGRFTFANHGAADLLGQDVANLTGMDAAALLGTAFRLSPTETGAPDAGKYESIVTRPDGSLVDLLISTAPIVLTGTNETGSLCMMSDVSGLRHAEEELAHRALHDALTGLPNRTLLTDRISHALARQRRNAGMVVALFCDLDGFKEVNDSFGHHVGDEVLKEVATRVQDALRPTDTLARIGGDEFVALCEGVDDESTAFGIAARVLAAVSEPVQIAGHEVSLSVSIGVAFAFTGDPAELLRNADAAMYLAKARGRNRAELFDEHLRQVASDRLGLIADLRHATARGELRLYYQPVFSLDGERLQGVEALVRWQHPTRGLLFPDTFIPAAESAHLIGEIGAWVLTTACRQAAAWATAGPLGGPIHMAVNVSARQLAPSSGLVELVAEALSDAHIDPSTLVLEVTETVVMEDAEAALLILTELKGLGVQLAIDDFGTGYSSLVYLKRFPVDQLKIDRSFVNGLAVDPDDTAIVASVVSLARAVGVVAIAEGVEDAHQLAALQALGCNLGQGYLWSRAVPAVQIDQILRDGGFAKHSSSGLLPMMKSVSAG
jgi:diguanylate cyclase (GGDEF)-like protein/PAS domain S-box-containing protein